MVKTKINKLRDEANRASRIEQVMSCNGWVDILTIIHAKYDSLMNELLEKENSEARGGINAITEIMDDISVELRFGISARNRYTEIYLKNQTKEG